MLYLKNLPFQLPESKPSIAEVPLPLTASMAGSAGKSREPAPSPHAHTHAHAHSHAHAHAQSSQYAGHPGLAAPAFLSSPSLFSIKSEPSAAAGYEGYGSHAGSNGPYHSQQHYLHALQVSFSNLNICANLARKKYHNSWVIKRWLSSGNSILSKKPPSQRSEVPNAPTKCAQK